MLDCSWLESDTAAGDDDDDWFEYEYSGALTWKPGSPWLTEVVSQLRPVA